MSASNWSVPETEVLAAARDALDSEQPATLATIVDVQGSAYRRPGAKMVIPEDEGGIGSITAGCLEDEVRSLAGEVLSDGEPRIETFDLMGDDDVWGLGVGCNGVIDILLEPLTEDYLPVLSAIADRENISVCTILESDINGIQKRGRAYYDEERGFVQSADAWSDWIVEAVRGPAETLAARGTAETLTIENDKNGKNDENGTEETESVSVFIDGIAAPPELFVFGTGHDVGPVCELAKNADFHVTVVGFRGASATDERFPAADRILSTSPGRVREDLTFDENTYAVVMTHNFIDDRLTIDELLDTPIPYVGLMGPRERFEEMQEDFAEEDRTFSREELQKLYTPAGLDLGGDTPYQIAHSIVSELLVIKNDRTPSHLEAREGPIHERVEFDAPKAND
jgi:xanthine dehydrogenase accessory factor